MPRTEKLSRGLWGVLATPFTQDQQVDDTSLVRQLQLHKSAGSVGLVVLGVFGEAARLSSPEQDHVVEVVSSAAPDLPLVIGLSELDTSAAVGSAVRLLARVAGRSPRFMVQANTADPSTLAAHLTAIHDATGAGLVLQDYPVASGVTLSSAALVEVVRLCPFVAAVKSEAPPTSLAIAQITAAIDVPVFGGLGGLGLLDELMAGAAGAMTGFSYPEALAEVLRAFDSGGYPAAREAYLPWLPLVNFEAQVKIGLGIRKASLVERGIFDRGDVRPPSSPMDQVLLPMLRHHLAPLREPGVL